LIDVDEIKVQEQEEFSYAKITLKQATLNRRFYSLQNKSNNFPIQNVFSIRQAESNYDCSI